MVEKQSKNTHKKVYVSGRNNECRREGEVNIVSAQTVRNPPPIPNLYRPPSPPPLYPGYAAYPCFLANAIFLPLTYIINKTRIILEIEGHQSLKEFSHRCLN